MSYSSILTSDGDQIKRAINYLRKMDASIQGQNGNGRLYSAAMAVAHGFNLPGETAVQLLL